MGELEPLQHGAERKGSMSARKFTGLLLALFLLIVGFLFIKSSYFKVGAVVVEGNHYISVEDVYRIAEIPEPLNIFSLNTSDIKTHLLHDLRIADVDVSRRFPGTIVINIQERKPIAYIASGYGFLELDQQGMVLAAFKNLKQIDVPMITNMRLDNEYVGDQVENPMLINVLKYLSLLDETAVSQISEVNVKSPEQIIAYTVKAIRLRLGNSEKLPEQAKLTNTILHEISEKKMNVEYIDLTYASPYIKLK